MGEGIRDLDLGGFKRLTAHAPPHKSLLDAWASYTWTPPLFQHAVGFNVEAVINYLFALNGGKISKKKINSIYGEI
uniref:Uncharacterized protein n=1 Tax=Salix viminalis TaxID=40686 RepID=A0A6N2KQT5_SALVM